MKYYHEIKELLCDLPFLLKSFYFLFNRIARHAQSKGSKNVLKKIPQITYKAIFRSCLEFWFIIPFVSLLVKIESYIYIALGRKQKGC
jgi:hypothetical protein